MIDQEKDGDCVVDGTRLDINVNIGGRVVEDAPIAPMHWPPDNVWAVGVGAARGVNPKLAAKLIGRIGCAPGDAGAIARTWVDLDLGKDARFEGATAVLHLEAGWPPKSMRATRRSLNDIGEITRQDKRTPAIWQLARRATLWAFHIADRLGDDIGRVALVRCLGGTREQNQKRHRDQGGGNGTVNVIALLGPGLWSLAWISCLVYAADVRGHALSILGNGVLQKCVNIKIAESWRVFHICLTPV